MKLEINKNHKKIDLKKIIRKLGIALSGGMVFVMLFSGIPKVISNMELPEEEIVFEQQSREEQNSRKNDIVLLSEEEIPPTFKVVNGETWIYVDIDAIKDDGYDMYIYEKIIEFSDDEGYISTEGLEYMAKNLHSCTISLPDCKNLEWLNYCENLYFLTINAYNNDGDYVANYDKLNCVKGLENLIWLNIYGPKEENLEVNGYEIKPVLYTDNLKFLNNCPDLTQVAILDCNIDLDALYKTVREAEISKEYKNFMIVSKLYYNNSCTNVSFNSGKIFYNNGYVCAGIYAGLSEEDVNEQDRNDFSQKLLSVVSMTESQPYSLNNNVSFNVQCYGSEHSEKSYFTIDSFNLPSVEQLQFNNYQNISIGLLSDICNNDWKCLNKFTNMEKLFINYYNSREEMPAVSEIINNIPSDTKLYLIPKAPGTYLDRLLFDALIESGKIISLPNYHQDDSIDLLATLSLEEITYLKDNGIINIDEDAFNKICEYEIKLNEIIQDMNLAADATEQEKFDAIAEYMKANYYFNSIDRDQENGWLASILDNGSGVYANYSILTTALANRLGLECYSVYSQSPWGSVWNVIKIDSKYYYTDLAEIARYANTPSKYEKIAKEWYMVPVEENLSDIDSYHRISKNVILPNNIQEYQFEASDQVDCNPINVVAMIGGGITACCIDSTIYYIRDIKRLNPKEKEKELSRKLRI